METPWGFLLFRCFCQPHLHTGRYRRSGSRNDEIARHKSADRGIGIVGGKHRDVCTSRYVPVSERARLDLDGQDELTVIILADSRIRHDGIVALSPLADSQLESLTDGNVATEGNGRDLGIARILRVVADTRDRRVNRRPPRIRNSDLIADAHALSLLRVKRHLAGITEVSRNNLAQRLTDRSLGSDRRAYRSNLSGDGSLYLSVDRIRLVLLDESALFVDVLQQLVDIELIALILEVILLLLLIVFSLLTL